MAQAHASSRKRMNLSDASQSGDLGPCFGRDCSSAEYTPRGPKRHRGAEPGLTGLIPHSNTFSSPSISSFVLLDNSFSSIYSQPEGEIDLRYDGFSAMFSPSPSLVFQQHLNIDDQFSLYQDLATSSNTAGTPLPYSMTNGTFSAGTLNMESLYDFVNQSPDGRSDGLNAGLDDFSFSPRDDLQFNEFSSNHLIFGNSGETIFRVVVLKLNHFQIFSTRQR